MSPFEDAWTPEQVAILLRDYPRHGAAHVAERTGRSVNAVRARAKRLRERGHAGLVVADRQASARRRHPRHWRPGEGQHAAHMLSAGYSLRAIAARLGKTPAAVRARAYRSCWDTAAESGWSPARLAAALGVGQKAVASWVAHGWLRSSRRPMTPGDRLTRRVISEAHLERFLSDRRYVALWRAGDIADSGIREWAKDLRPPWTPLADLDGRTPYTRRELTIGCHRGLIVAFLGPGPKGECWIVHEAEVPALARGRMRTWPEHDRPTFTGWRGD